MGSVRFPVAYPSTAVEINADAITAVRLRSDRSGARLTGYGIAPLHAPTGASAVSPPSETGLGRSGAAASELRRALDEAIQSAGIKAGKATLLVPDSLARVWLLQLPEFPRGNGALLDMIKWKIKRGVAHRIEDSAIAWQILSRPSGNEPGVILVGLLPKHLVMDYERLMASAGLTVGLVDLSSFNLYNAYRPTIESSGGGGTDVAVINATEGYFTLMIFRRGELIFYRCKSHAEGEMAQPEERARTFRRELATSLSYYTEKLKGLRLDRTYARIADPSLEDAGEVIDALGFGGLEAIDPSKIAALPPDIHESTARYLAPAMGAAMGKRR